MALLFELVSSVAGLALKPLLFAKLSCQIGVRSVSIIIQTCLELLRFALSVHFVIIWRLVIWSIAVLSLPVRACTALYRERLLEMQFHRLRNEMENILWDRKELEEQLHITIKECKMMETILMELEEEHDEAILKIELLEAEVQDLKNETKRLKEIQGKALCSYWGRGNVDSDCNYISQRRDYNKNLCKDDRVKAGSKIYGLMQLYVTNMNSNEGEVALYRSLFSAILSLVVGIVVWETEGPCMPLVVALLTTVTISLVSVLQLFTKIEHECAFESIALLSFNWFILGTVAYPLLPIIARFLSPLALSFLLQFFKWLGL